MSNIVKAFQFIIPLIALFIAWRSCNISQESIDISKESNERAEEANEVSKVSNKIALEALRTTKKTNRPYISLEPLEFKDGYLLARERDNKLELECGFIMKNRGSILAKNIRLPKEITKFKDSKGNTCTVAEFPNEITLAPEQSMTLVLIGKSEMEKQQISKFINNVDANKNYQIFKIVVFFTSELDPSEEYCSWMLAKFWKDHAQVIASDAN